jgi:hypothetical protein
MPQFEYEITRHSFEMFRDLVYYCTEAGECSLEGVPEDQIIKLKKMLNEHGGQGFELVQIAFGANGFLAFWKRQKA